MKSMTPPSSAQSLEYMEAKNKIAELFCVAPREVPNIEDMRPTLRRDEDDDIENLPTASPGDIVGIA